MAKKKICLDAGHCGKYNRSPANNAYYESDMVWKLHLLLKKYLEQYGFEVTQTRSTQAKYMDLAARGKASKGCDLFLSIHSNAVGSSVNESIDYPVVYVPLNGKGDKIGKLLADCIAEVMGTKQKGRTATRKGNNGEYYGVIRGAVAVGVPGLILEHSFHTNTRSTEWLLDDDNLDKLAKAEAAVIADYYGVKAPVTGESSECTTSPVTSDSALYYVQAGSYGKKENAEAQLKKIRAKGFDACITILNGQYKIQVGAFSKKANAEAQLAKVKAAGFDAFIATKGGKAVAESAPKKSVKEVAHEVIQGKWGNGAERKAKLTAAGYDYAEVQKMVNELLG